MSEELKIDEEHTIELFIPVGYPTSGNTTHVYTVPCTTRDAANAAIVAGEKRIFKIVIPMRYAKN